jgi:hypothetical protein
VGAASSSSKDTLQLSALSFGHLLSAIAYKLPAAKMLRLSYAVTQVAASCWSCL